MTPWRIGTARIEGAPRVIVAHEGGLHLLDTLLGPGAPPDVRSFIARQEECVPALEAALAGSPPPDLRQEPVWEPPLMPAKLICIGANYADHNAEMLGEVISAYPSAFLTPPTTTLLGAGRPAPLPTHARDIDYEVELCVVIGRRARSVPRSEALAHVFGYAVLNDLSARDWVRTPSLLGLDWIMLKGFDASAPMGPLITPARFAGNPDDLAIRLWVNDELRQDSRTSEMVFDTAALIAHLSTVMTLEPGDLIATGTPSGVGPILPGDVVEATIEGIGSLRNPVVAG